MNREIELDVTRTQNVQKTRNSELEVVLEYLKKSSDKTLKVYIDSEANKKYITNAAAYEIGFISYESFCSNDEGYYLITELLLNLLKRKHKVEYVYWNKEISSPREYMSLIDEDIEINKKNEFSKDKDLLYPNSIDELKELRNKMIESNYKDFNDMEMNMLPNRK